MLPTLLLSLTLLPGQGAPAKSRLAVIEKAPAFRLIDQSGKPCSSAGLKGKVLLVGFVFTTCNGSCPATTHRMGLVQRELQARGLLKGERVRLVSITLDPKRDTPEVLRAYMGLYDADPASWSFLTGPSDQVAKVVAAWGMWAKPAANGQLDHPSRVFLVDARGFVREIYNLDFMRPAWVVEDIELLLGEKS
jgi:protein SCO1/2